jgi:signal transduction histidine kinase
MNLLIVDDIATNRKLLRVTLEAEDHTTLEAADGVEALQILAREKVDAVISDILMPNMDGFRLCHEIRKSERLRALPFIVYTSTYKSPDDMKLAKTVGADKYLTKPAPTAAVLEALREVMESRTARPVPPMPAMEESYVLKQYTQAVVNKLEDKNAELKQAVDALQRAHDRIVELNNGLERRVRERTQDLGIANHQLMQKSEEIQQFYHTLSHELKTPLTSAREFVSFVEEGVAGPVTGTQREYLLLAKEGCDHMARCLDDLLDATRLDTGKLSLELKTSSLTKLAHRVLKSLQPAIAAKGIVVETEFDETAPDISCDEYRIAQVLTNLINNALKFTPEGGRLRVQIDRSATHPDSLQVAVTDTGRGIPVNLLERIFERLYQVKEGDAATGLGMGLGLYLCRELITLHGGEIHVESELDRGSRFNFWLPLHPPAAARYISSETELLPTPGSPETNHPSATQAL